MSEELKRNQSVKFAMTIVMAFFMCMLVASWVATQYLASSLAYQHGLGQAVHVFANGVKIYQPFSWWVWNYQWMNETGPLQDLLTRMQFILVAGAILSVIIAVYLAYKRSMHGDLPNDLHGSARWANLKDIEQMGLISHVRKERKGLRSRSVQYRAVGVYIGAYSTKDGLKVLRYDEPAHVLCFAPSRSGKGVGLVLPTLLSYPHSTATNDVKGENFELTSGFRHTAGSLVIRFDPTALDQRSIDGKSRFNVAACWNVLDEIRAFTEYDVMDAQNIATAIADPNGEGMDDHWVSTSYELLVGVILHMLYYERDKSLNGVATYLADPSFTDPEQMFNRMLDAEHDPDGVMGWVDSSGKPTKTHPAVALSARAMLNKEERERGSVLSTAKTKLSLYTEPIVARNTSRSDFCVNDLMNHRKPVSLYIVVPPSDKERLRPLVRLFITFLLRRLTASMAFEDGAGAKSYLHKLLLLIDELPSLRKLDQLQDGLSYIAGYGITAYLFVQDLIQLREAYGDNQTIAAGCQVKIAFAPNTRETAEELSTMTGLSTQKRQNVSYSGSRISSMLGQMSVSEELVERPLMTPDEVLRLPRDEMLVFNTGHSAIRAKKLFYYKMPEFLSRAKIASPSKVSMAYRDEKGKVRGSWFMVLCERIAGSKEIKVSINCYDTFPAVRVLIKQEDEGSGNIQTFEYELTGEDGRAINRELTADDLRFVLKPKVDVSSFEPQEAFEVHFLVVDARDRKSFSQTGFFRDISIFERDARRAAKTEFQNQEGRDGIKRDPTFEKVVANKRYIGRVFLETDHFTLMNQGGDLVSLHRKKHLDRVPAVGDIVTIQYEGKKGAVQ
jgi:type IV secretion system protein VirD4